MVIVPLTIIVKLASYGKARKLFTNVRHLTCVSNRKNSSRNNYTELYLFPGYLFLFIFSFTLSYFLPFLAYNLIIITVVGTLLIRLYPPPSPRTFPVVTLLQLVYYSTSHS